MMKYFLTLVVLMSSLVLSSGAMAKDTYIDGPDVGFVTSNACNALRDARHAARNAKVKRELLTEYRALCGFRFVQSLQWYITNKQNIPRIYGNIFSSSEMKRKYLYLFSITDR